MRHLPRQGYWRTADGRNIKYEEIGDDHLRNIIIKGIQTNNEVPADILKEYKKRNLVPKYSSLKKHTIEELQSRIEALEERLLRLEKIQEL